MSGRTLKLVTKHEFWVFWGIIVASAAYGEKGENLFREGGKGIIYAPNLGRFMKFYRFKDIKSFIPWMVKDESRKDKDPWWQFVKAVEDFNANRKSTVAASIWKVFDESMSAYRPRTTKTGGLPNISWIERKPEPLGTELKNVACALTGIMLALEIQRGANNEVVLGHDHLNTCCAVSTRLAELSARCGQTEERADIFQGDSWFSSCPTVESIDKLGHKYKGILKVATAGYPKDWLEETMHHYPGGTHLVLESVKGGRKMYAIGYKYSSKKVLTFIASEGSGSTLPGHEYETRFPDRHGNVHSRKIARPRIVSTYFSYNNAIDSHNHARQYELGLEKFWVTHDPYFRLITTLFGITVTDCWKTIRYHVNDKHELKDISIRSFANLLAGELLHNAFDDICPDTSNFTITDSLPGDRESEVRDHPQGIESVVVGDRFKESVSELTCDGGHRMETYPEVTLKNGKKRCRRNRCRMCLKKGVVSCSRFFCSDCKLCFCADGSGRGELVRMCWTEHKKHQWHEEVST